MSTSIPTAQCIRVLLQGLSTVQVRELSLRSSVPFTTLLKIRSGETRNPGIETVRLFVRHLGEERINTPGAPPVPTLENTAREAA